MKLENKLYKFADHLEKQGYIQESQEVDDIVTILMNKQSNKQNAIEDIVNFIKTKLIKKKPVVPQQKGQSVQDILDKQWEIKDPQFLPKDYTGNIMK